MKTLIKALIALVITCQATLASAQYTEFKRTVVEKRIFTTLKNSDGWNKKSLAEFVEFMAKVETAAGESAAQQKFMCSVSIASMVPHEDGLFMRMNLDCLSKEWLLNQPLDIEKLVQEMSKQVGVKIYEDEPQARTGGATVHN
jgi:hypothetical protein